VEKLTDQVGYRSRLAAVSAVTALALAGVLALRAGGLLVGLELFAYDRMLRHAVSGPHASSPLVIVEITEQDIREQGHWPISDRTLVEAVIAILDDGAGTIGLDIFRNLPVPPGTEILQRVMREEPRIIAARTFGDPEWGGIEGPPALHGSGRVGFADVLFDADETVRRALIYQDDGDGEVASSFPLLVALTALAADEIYPVSDPDELSWLKLGPTTLRPLESDDGGYLQADARGYQILVDFASGKTGFPTYRLGSVLSGEIAPGAFRDRVVLIGTNAKSLPDILEVSLGGRIPGVEFHAHVADQLLRHARGISAPTSVPPSGVEIGCIVLAAILGCALSCTMRRAAFRGVSGLLMAMFGVAILIVAAATIAFQHGFWFPVMGVELSWFASAGFVTAWLSNRERSERAELMGLFARHVSTTVADEIWRRRGEFLRDGRLKPLELPATVMFVDMKGYSAQAEKMRPAQLLVWVNEFLERMAREVERHHGVVEDYYGDGFKADFGVPIPRSSAAEIAEDARHAVESALAIAATLDEINEGYRARGLPSCAVRVGIHSDTAVAGSIGSPGHLKYSVVGDVSVTAARLGSTARIDHDFDRAPCRIIVSERTLELLGDRYKAESVGRVDLKGKREAVAAYRILKKNGAL
jgi:adenylate cyclase